MATVAEAAIHDPARQLEALFRAHHVRVLKAAYRITGSMADAEDVASAVFLRLAQRGGAGVENAESYLYRAAINGALDLLRSRQEMRRTALHEVEHLPGTASEQSRSEVRDWLRQALARLNPRHAEMFVLRHLEGHDNREIARMLNTSRAVVAVVLHRTRAKLRRDYTAALGGKR